MISGSFACRVVSKNLKKQRTNILFGNYKTPSLFVPGLNFKNTTYSSYNITLSENCSRKFTTSRIVSEGNNKIENVADLIPEWFKTAFPYEQVEKKLGNFDVKFYDKPFVKTFPDVVEGLKGQAVSADKTMFHLRPDMISDADLSKLCYVPRGKSKDYICVGEAYYFPLHRDLPVHYTPSSPSLLYIEVPDKSGKDNQPKILYQLAPFVPPMFWIPLKPSIESLTRLFEEIMEIESSNVSRHLDYNEDLLAKIGFNVEKLKELDPTAKSTEKEYNDLHAKFLDYINKTLDPNKLEFKERVLQEYPNTVSLFLGNVSALEDLEQTLMNCPFVFNTPIVLGSSNRFLSSESIQRSMFHTVFSRSLIIIEARYDLHVDFGSNSADRLIPVFARIHYPTNQRLSKPCTDRMNKVFDCHFPSDLPVDVCLALFGQKNGNADSIAAELMRIVKEDEELIKSGTLDQEDLNSLFNPSIPIAHLAVLQYEKWPTEIFEKFKNHPLPIVRIACVKGCVEFLMLEKLKEMQQIEKHHEVLQYVNESIVRLEKKIELLTMRKQYEEEEIESKKKQQEKEEQAILDQVEKDMK